MEGDIIVYGRREKSFRDIGEKTKFWREKKPLHGSPDLPLKAGQERRVGGGEEGVEGVVGGGQVLEGRLAQLVELLLQLGQVWAGGGGEDENQGEERERVKEGECCAFEHRTCVLLLIAANIISICTAQ